jgi:EAL and modified HD-GYP domain-containing signal transduction protein
MGINELTGGQPAFLRFTRNVLLGGYAQILPKEKLVVEILDNMPPDKEVLDTVRRLRDGGYTVALNDFDGKALQSPLVDLANIIKVNFKLTSRIKQNFFARRFLRLGIKLVAEKIESYDGYHAAKEMGYSLFQGSFFCQPSIVSTQRIPESKMTRLRLMQLVNQEEMDFGKASEIIKHDVALSYKLLRYANSAYLGLHHQVTNIRQALMFLGQRNLRRWISLMAVACLGDQKPSALLVTALMRARFCELLADVLGMRPRGDDLFLLGMFSTIDALLDRPMEDALKDIPLAPDLKATLLGESGVFRDILELVLSYEAGDWKRFDALSRKLDIDQDGIPQIHLEAVNLAEGIFKAEDRGRILPGG